MKDTTMSASKTTICTVEEITDADISAMSSRVFGRLITMEQEAKAAGDDALARSVRRSMHNLVIATDTRPAAAPRSVFGELVAMQDRLVRRNA